MKSAVKNQLVIHQWRIEAADKNLGTEFTANLLANSLVILTGKFSEHHSSLMNLIWNLIPAGVGRQMSSSKCICSTNEFESFRISKAGELLASTKCSSLI